MIIILNFRTLVPFHFRPDMIALAGNKSDLANLRAVKYKEANGYAEENGLLFMETSAKNENNVKEIFLAIARKSMRYRIREILISCS